MSIQHWIVLIFCCFYSINPINGQSNTLTIQGQVFDSINWQVPPEARLLLLHHNDTISRNPLSGTGRFTLSSTQNTDQLILIAEAPFYNIYKDTFSTKGKASIHLDTIYMTPAHVLKEVTIQSGYKSKIDKDTASFTADSIVIKQFDNAEQLLEKIPGIEITAGKGILYYGRPINEVNIDGIPFSGFDTRSLLKLLRGRDIDKLKIYDSKPNAENNFTEKSSPEKAMNILLKEEAKHGYFGKLSAGLGKVDPFHWDNNTNVSSFNDRRNIVAYATSNNTGGTSAYGESALTEQNTTDVPRGTPTDITAGIHFDERFLNNKLSVNGNYGITYNKQHANTATTDINFLPDGQITTSTQSNTHSNSNSSNANVRISYQIDPSSSLSLTGNSSLAFIKGNIGNNASIVNNDHEMISTSILQSSYHGTAPQVSLNLSYAKVFKNGSNLICSFLPYWNKNVTNMDQSSILEMPGSGNIQESLQKKSNKEANNTYTFTSYYKLPLTKHLSVEATWISDLSGSKAQMQTYDQYADSDNNIKDSLNPVYSSDYAFYRVSNSVSTKIYMRRKKYSAQLGADFKQAFWDQQNAYSNTNQTRAFINALPFANINVTTGKTSFASANYKLQATQPSLEQIQPLVNNNNPLQIIVGNADLTQSFTHNLSLNYTVSSKDGNRSFNANSNISIIENAISLKQTIDENGKEVSQYYNQDGNYLWNTSSGYDIYIANKIRLSAGAGINRARTISIVNSKENIALTNSYNSRLSCAYILDTTLNIQFNSGIVYSSTQTTLNSGNNPIFNYVTSINLAYSTPLWGLSMGTYLTWNSIRSNIGDAGKRDFFIWNAYLQRCINKSQSLSIKLYAYDLLNQNKGYLVYIGNNVQHKESYNSLERYFLLGIVWNFTKR